MIDYGSNIIAPRIIAAAVYGDGMYGVFGTLHPDARENSPIAITSPDAVNWTKTVLHYTDYIGSITFGNGVFVAVGQNGIMTSLTALDGRCRIRGPRAPMSIEESANGVICTTWDRGRRPLMDRYTSAATDWLNGYGYEPGCQHIIQPVRRDAPPGSRAGTGRTACRAARSAHPHRSGKPWRSGRRCLT